MLFTQVPRVCWLKPMVQNETTFSFGSAYIAASAFRSLTGTPEIADAFSTVYSETNLANSSKLIGSDLLASPLGLPSAPG